MMMTSVQIAAIILCVVFGSTVLGLTVSKRLAPHHLSPEAKATISVSMAVVGTMTAVVIGFLISNASNSFKARNAAVAALAADIAQLDSLLRRYGPETDPIRNALQRYTELKFEDLFPTKANGRRDVDSSTTARVLDDVQDQILRLRSGDERQHWLSAQALAAAVRVSAAQSKMVEENANSVPLPFVGGSHAVAGRPVCQFRPVRAQEYRHSCRPVSKCLRGLHGAQARPGSRHPLRRRHSPDTSSDSYFQ